MKNIPTVFLFHFLLYLPSFTTTSAADGFAGVRCGTDIPKSLVGRRFSNEPVVKTEERHKDLALENLGGYEISKVLFYSSWLICGSEYMLLEARSVVRDAVLFPSHSKSFPGFIGTCQINGRETPHVVVAVLENQPGKDTLPAREAWKVDEERARFVKMSTEGLRCPGRDVFTRDGGL